MVRSIKNCLFLYVPVAIRVAIPAAVSGRTHSPGSLPDHSLHGGRERGKGPVRRPFAAVGDLERCYSLQKRAADRLPAFLLPRHAPSRHMSPRSWYAITKQISGLPCLRPTPRLQTYFFARLVPMFHGKH